ncbi:hypothetical protein IIC65_04125, partial [Candidatus Sumerlaeota bacterium]|nr:hypothetical protein [Candidatus Sumerlaeota bacterium]
TPAADTAGGGASPLIDSLTDATGGLLVVGDIVDINGSNLDTVDAAFVGDLPAPILSQSASQMRIQIPQGVRNGVNSVRLVDLDGDTGFSASAAVRVHRLAIFIGQARGQIVIVDTTDNSIVTTISQTISSANWPYCVAFANNGSLAFVPTGTGVNIFIDMTADPPTSGSVRDGSQIMGYAVSPDNLLVAAADRSGGAIRTLEILEFEPPYADPVTIGRSLIGFSRPRCPVFLNNEFLAVALEGRDEIAVLERGSDRFTDLDFIRYDTGLDRPSQLRLDPRRATLFAFGLGGRLASFRVSEESLGLVGSRSTFGAIAFDLSPSGDFAYVADDSLNLIMPVWIGAGSLSRIASPRIRFEESGDPSGFIINTIAVDPVEGAYAYLGLDDGDFVDVFDIINGATFVRRAESRLGGQRDLDNCRGIGIQP